MKKIIISAVIIPTDDAVTVANLMETLRRLGSAYFTTAAQVEMVDVNEMELTKSVWIYIPSDDEESFEIVSGPGETDGDVVSAEDLETMRETGVCLEFNAEYPDSGKYGAPDFATEDVFAEGLIGEYGFRIPSEGLVVTTNDRGDDGSQQIWLKIAIPA